MPTETALGHAVDVLALLASMRPWARAHGNEAGLGIKAGEGRLQ